MRGLAFVKLLSVLLIALVASSDGMLAQDAPVKLKAMSYEVVSIKPSDPNNHMMRTMMRNGNLSANGTSLKMLVQMAYGVKMADFVYGLPKVMDDARFDVEAKADGETTEAFNKLAPTERTEQNQAMVRAMLEDRFKLKAHMETKELPVYSLIVAKGGLKIEEANPNDTYPNGIKGPDGVSHPGMMRMGNGTLNAQAIAMDMFVANLGYQVNRLVINNTGLTGKYDFALEWQPENGSASATQTNGLDTKPSIFTAVQEQLGLKLEPTKGPVETVVVDHVEMPSEN